MDARAQSLGGVFLKKHLSSLFVGILVASLVVGPMAAAADLAADVVVIGAGGAGVTAANYAADRGARVILLEKMPFPGGASLLAAGNLTAAGTKLQEKLGVEAPAGEFQRQLEEEAVFPYDAELVRVHAERSGEALNFMIDLGVEFWPELMELPYRHKTVDPNTARFIKLALDAFKSKGGEVLLRTRATELIMDNGSIAGVKAAASDGREMVIGAKAVVIATGDFSANQSMMSDEYKNALGFGPVSSTGDGILMAQVVGAATMNMDKAVFFGNAVEVSPGQAGFSWGRSLCDLGAIYVNSDGVRFSKDVMNSAECAQAMHDQEVQGKAIWVVFDEAIKNDLHAKDFPTLVTVWDPETEAKEIEKGEHIIKADDIGALARRMGVAPEKLQETIDNYAQYVKDGQDPEFNRPSFARAIAEGPYYAMRQRIGIYPTIGGLCIDTKARVLDDGGQPILGLYAAGDVAGGVSTNGRDTLIPAMVYGMIAGEEAAGLAR
jgi:flavocytochrome c